MAKIDALVQPGSEEALSQLALGDAVGCPLCLGACKQVSLLLFANFNGHAHSCCSPVLLDVGKDKANLCHLSARVEHVASRQNNYLLICLLPNA